ncbi:MAG: acylglycerol kinase family protein, partial [Alphaproteobacteria bacterium]|nr:acylglycerol kinase family protein [Alphaproteobacteria bacterium]
MTASIRVVVNPTAGRRRGKFLQRVLAGLAARHVPHDVAETAAVGHARRIAAELPRTTRTIVAAGGDGTINEVLNGLAAGGATG